METGNKKMTGFIILKYAGVHPKRRVDRIDVDSLTARQRKVLTLIAAGYLNWEIADHLGVSVRTVETHRDHLMRRTGVRTVADLTRLAILNELVILR